MHLIYMAIFGLIVGFIAKLIIGGKSGWVITMILGLLGSFVGGYLTELPVISRLITGYTFAPFVAATLGAIIILFIYHKVKGL